MALSVKDHLSAGALQAAIDAATADVRGKPREAGARYLLAQLLCIKGELERADQQLDTIVQQEMKLGPTVTTLRQVIRAEQARRQFYNEGRLPDFLRQPADYVKLYIEAAVLLRKADVNKANELLEQAEELRPHRVGVCDGNAFDDLRDLDDVSACYLEVLTSTGKFYVVPIEDVTRIEFHGREQPSDLIWRRAQLSVREGPDGEVYIPAIYCPIGETSERSMLGRTTDWVGGDGEPIRGVGQRCFLVGEESVPIMQLEIVEFSALN
jgi:type VI secretion system protein ImpE